ncbi:hypothetical protein J2Z21_009346 [Streptomyces griseochromogenes]|uniref:Sporulation protein n=1 Tax=Streptomyces griseochromogenes TaxID=68214 RepID=A0A1B1B4G9_9ACTN|nr:hypothetical protein [Streptomyces griseochromogenes]ANP53661.1 hypothetical protein AVL59_32620 [Streptomyces griseochromogenes]MBP2056328.1 hypothetical protein [Streptomyces griseochromogenes]
MTQRNARLAALMQEADFSHKSLARAVVAAAALAGEDTTCDHTYVTRWLKGSIPRGNMPQFIADAIGRKLGRRLTIDDIGMGDAAVSAIKPDLGLDFADRPEAAVKTVADLWRADLAEAEALVRTQPDSAAWNTAALRWLVAPPDGALTQAGDRAIGAMDVEMVRATADAFSMLDGKFGGGHARRALIQYLHTDVRPMLDGRYSDAVGKQLYSAVAEALLLAGWMSYDSCLHGIAQRYFLQALRMTQAAGDRRLGGSILSAMSHQATFMGRYEDAATLARAAYTGPGASLGPTMAAQFRAMEARALARLGDERGCDLALVEAERQLSQRTADSDPPYIAYFDEIELAAEIGHCFRDLGRSAEATERGAGSIFGNGMNTRSDFFATMVQAEAYINQGEIGRGFEIALSALSLGESLKSARGLQYVREFQGRVTDGMRRAAEFRDFTERARRFRLWQEAGIA